MYAILVLPISKKPHQVKCSKTVTKLGRKQLVNNYSMRLIWIYDTKKNTETELVVPISAALTPAPAVRTLTITAKENVKRCFWHK